MMILIIILSIKRINRNNNKKTGIQKVTFGTCSHIEKIMQSTMLILKVMMERMFIL